MSLTPKQKVYGSFLVLCGSVLIVDRVFLGPSEAAAEQSVAPQVAVAVTTSDTPVDASVTQGAIAARLDLIATEEALNLTSVPDAFTPPAAWQSAVVTQVEATGDVVRAFLDSHHLTAVMEGGASGYAVIDGRGLHIGQALDGFRLTAVGDRSATFLGHGRTLELTLAAEGVESP